MRRFCPAESSSRPAETVARGLRNPLYMTRCDLAGRGKTPRWRCRKTCAGLLSTGSGPNQATPRWSVSGGVVFRCVSRATTCWDYSGRFVGNRGLRTHSARRSPRPNEISQLPFPTSVVNTSAGSQRAFRDSGGGDLLRQTVVEECRFGSQSDGAPLRRSVPERDQRLSAARLGGIFTASCHPLGPRKVAGPLHGALRQ